MNADEHRFSWSGWAVCVVVVAAVTLSPIARSADEATCKVEQSKLLAQLPAVSNEYKKIQDMQYWRNPYLVVLRDGVELRAGGNGKRPKLAIADLAHALAELPPSAWPYGRVIGVQDQGLISGDDWKYIQQNHKRVDVLLRCLGLEANWVPSA
jgi:hypothetical protein